MTITISKPIGRFFCIGLIGLALSACTLRARNKPAAMDNNKVQITKVVITPQMNSSELSEAGEKLLTPETLPQADHTFTMALQKDPENRKAQFYKALLQRFMAFKGILTRIQPLIDDRKLNEKYHKELKKIPETPLKDFLLDGPQDIKDVSDAQSFINQYVRAVNNFREFLLQNPELNFTLNLNPNLFKTPSSSSVGKTCKILPTTPETIEAECQTSSFIPQQVNPADLLMLRQISAAEIMAFSWYASYSLEGIENLMDREDFSKLSHENQLSLIKEQPSLLTLRTDHVMGLWEGILQDFVAATRWAEKSQKDLCPKGFHIAEVQRPGHLFYKGLCLPMDERSVIKRDTALAIIEKALSGVFTYEGVTDQGKAYQTEVDPLIISRMPIGDLKTLLPLKAVPCGERPLLPDPTMAGIFPQGDGAEFFKPSACEE